MKSVGMIRLSGTAQSGIESGPPFPLAPVARSSRTPLFALTLSACCDPREVHERWLLLRVAAGDDQAFWELWTPHSESLYLICFAQMGRRVEDAEDALSEVMHRAHDTLPMEALRVRNLKAWLRRVTVNLCIDLYRRNRRRQRALCATELERFPEHRAAAFGGPSPAADLEASEVRGIVLRAVESLPSRLRAASRLFFLQAAPYERIAAELKITAPNARKRVQQARSLLREKLRREFPGSFQSGVQRG